MVIYSSLQDEHGVDELHFISELHQNFHTAQKLPEIEIPLLHLLFFQGILSILVILFFELKLHQTSSRAPRKRSPEYFLATLVALHFTPIRVSN